MAKLILLIGPQGVGKTILGDLIAAGIKSNGGTALVVQEEEAIGMHNSLLRSLVSDPNGAVIVEATSAHERLGAMEGHEWVVRLNVAERS
mgnify:CR=1 FL=1